jgi:hypothetical protein
MGTPAAAGNGVANATPRAAAKVSRRPRQNIRITCTCSKYEEKSSNQPVFVRMAIVSGKAKTGEMVPVQRM